MKIVILSLALMAPALAAPPLIDENHNPEEEMELEQMQAEEENTTAPRRSPPYESDWEGLDLEREEEMSYPDSYEMSEEEIKDSYEDSMP